MKVIWLSYNQDSILNNGFSRLINTILIIVLLCIHLLNENEDAKYAEVNNLSISNCIIIIACTSIISLLCTTKVINDTTFYEWDYTERKKKGRFLTLYNLICIAISGLLCLSKFVAFKWYTSVEFQNIPLLKYGSLFPPFFFLFNLMNIPSLYCLSEFLKIEYKIQKKPDNWQEDGEEITDKDKIREIIKNDWGIDM